MGTRSSNVTRKTAETDIQVQLNIDGSGNAQINSGIGFFDHLLNTLVKHSRMDVQLTCSGDTQVDDHHSVEDCALVLGSTLNKALGARVGIKRFGSAYAPLDEALARAVIDLSGRPACVVELNLDREQLGEIATENISHFFQSFASTLKAAIHIDVLRGDNDHHKAEAAFKALALALHQAVQLCGNNDIPSTKGVLTT